MIRVMGSPERELPWRPGMTVADVLELLADPYPYAVVRIDRTAVSRPHFAATKVPDGAKVFLIPLIAGG
jgi:sulfur carrier protein ThiS